MLCPTIPQACKLVNKFIGIMSRARSSIVAGSGYLNYPTWDPNLDNPFILGLDIFDNSFSVDQSENDASFSDLSSSGDD